jgi:hypothetical protein
MITLFAVMILFWVILGCYDYKKYNRQFILSQLKKEIMKQLIPYKKDDDKNVIAKTMVPHQFTEVVTDIGMLNNVKFKKKGKRGNKGKKFYRSRHVTDIDEEDSDGNSNNNNSNNNSNNSSNDDNVSDYNKETDIYNYKKDILTINKYDGNSNESESDKKDNTIEYENKFDLRKRRNFFNKQTAHNPFVFNINIVSNSNNNNNIHEEKFSDGDINTTDKDKHNKSIDNAEELQITKRKLFIDLNFTYCEFVCFNMRERNLFVTTFVNPSLFNPRWCKLILFTTEITLHMIMASVQLTMDENAFPLGVAVGSGVYFFCSIVLMTVLFEFISYLITAPFKEYSVLLDNDSITYDNTCIKYEDVYMIEIDSGMMSKNRGCSEPCYLNIFSDKDNGTLIP